MNSVCLVELEVTLLPIGRVTYSHSPEHIHIITTGETKK